jgi:hypothetical protein
MVIELNPATGFLAPNMNPQLGLFIILCNYKNTDISFISYPIVFYPILSYPLLSYPILSDLILSYSPLWCENCMVKLYSRTV